uniref:hypothetical protein n=1 Tax=Limosilactobacillus difficilis TaxID=2991838 RepID=UPI0024B97BCA
KLSVYANFSHKKIPPKSISNFGGTHQIVTSRLLIFIILAINIVMLLWQISSQPMWLLLKSIYLVFTICIMEIVFRRIRETFGSPNLNLTLILLLIIYGVLIII